MRNVPSGMVSRIDEPLGEPKNASLAWNSTVNKLTWTATTGVSLGLKCCFPRCTMLVSWNVTDASRHSTSFSVTLPLTEVTIAERSQTAFGLPMSVNPPRLFLIRMSVMLRGRAGPGADRRR